MKHLRVSGISQLSKNKISEEVKNMVQNRHETARPEGFITAEEVIKKLRNKRAIN